MRVVAQEWMGAPKSVGKQSKTFTPIPWSAMSDSDYATIPPGKQCLLRDMLLLLRAV